MERQVATFSNVTFPVATISDADSREFYVKATSSDASKTGSGTEEDPYGSLEYAVQEAPSGSTIHLMSDLTMVRSARFWDKALTIDGNGYTIQRGDGFEFTHDGERGGYHPAMIEVGVTYEKNAGVKGKASLTLKNITLDDLGKREGKKFKQANAEGKGKNEDFVQDAIVATYGGKDAEIILDEGTVLKNFGGMSAVRLSAGKLLMKDGSQICDDIEIDRKKSTKDDFGAAGAVWIQGGELVMEEGSEISNVTGRAVYVDGGQAEIGGTIEEITADGDMWQDRNGVALHIRDGGKAVLKENGVIRKIYGETPDKDSAVHTFRSDFEAEEGSEISACENIMAFYANDYNENNSYQHKVVINGSIKDCTTSWSLVCGWYANITIGPSCVISGCTANGDGGLLYSSNGVHYLLEGKIQGNTASNGMVYLANQGGGRVEAEMRDGAEITGNEGPGIYVNNGAWLTMNGGKISENSSYGVRVRGKSKFKGVQFVMNGGEICDNKSYGVWYTNTAESIVELNGEKVSGNNGTSYDIYASGGNASDKNEFIYINEGVLSGSRKINVSAGTVTLDEGYHALWLGNAKTDAVNKIKTLLTEVQPTWKTAGSTALWIKPTSDDYHFTITRPSSADTSGLYAVYLPLDETGLPAADLTAEDLKLIPVENSENIEVIMEGAKAGQAYALMFVNNDKYSLYPASLSIYSGTQLLDAADYSIGGIDKITSIKVGDEETTYKTYGDGPKQAKEDLKALFTLRYVDENGEELTSAAKAGEYRAEFRYRDPEQEGKIKVNGNDIEHILDGTLRIRFTNEPAEDISYPMLAEEPTASPSNAVAVEQKLYGVLAPDYYLNGDTNRKLSDVSGIALLEDDPLTDGNADSVAKMEQRIAEYLGRVAGFAYQYDFHYLDLIDKNSGNAWVSSNSAKKVYLPYPEGTDCDTAFTLVRFADLNREYGFGGQSDVESAIQNSALETLAVETTELGICFDAKDFGMFALVWGVPQNTVTVRYLDAETDSDIEGVDAVVRSFASGTRYDVSEEASLAIDGYTFLRVEGDVTGILTNDALVKVYYTKNAEPVDPDPSEPTDPSEPEKETAQVVYRVVNGTFTENGETELTKTYQLGETIDSAPEAKANAGYSGGSWDVNPVGQKVESDALTFVLTFHKNSSGGGGTSGGGSSSSGGSGSVTNAQGKSGQWVLEGNEFTENNGKLPSNEYLKIDGTIYGFYTNGIAIGFDHAAYYTDEAIQAKGGYRDAEGSWRVNGWWFNFSDGTYPRAQWEYLTYNGRSDWYYFDEDGWMEDGWLFWNNNWYYLHTQYDGTRGHMYTGWHEIDGKWYYFRTSSDGGSLGSMMAGGTTPDGYQLGTDGAMLP